jgi:hypothetical protein
LGATVGNASIACTPGKRGANFSGPVSGVLPIPSVTGFAMLAEQPLCGLLVFGWWPGIDFSMRARHDEKEPSP